ncbi:MAG: helix-turn-helix transcriptional regulator [Caldilineaceae bacterium]
MATPIFAALADPTRRQLLADLAEGSPKTATQLALAYPITRRAILDALTILAEAGLVTVRQQGRDKQYTLTLNHSSKWNSGSRRSAPSGRRGCCGSNSCWKPPSLIRRSERAIIKGKVNPPV